jgi:hypothetical protein
MKRAVGPGYACANGEGRKPNSRAGPLECSNSVKMMLSGR